MRNILTLAPRSTTLAFALCTCLALAGALRVTTDPSNERLFLQHRDTYRVYQRFLTTFGSDETILAVLHHPETSLLQPSGLAAIRALTEDLSGHPHVSSVTSLTTALDLSRLDVTPFGLAAPPLNEGNQPTAEQIAAIRANDVIIGTLLSADLRTTGILVTPDHASLSFAERRAWLSSLRTLVTRHARQGRQTYAAGTPFEHNDVDRYLRRDQELTIPLVMMILLGVTYGIYRQLRLAIIPIACVALALLWTMGLVGLIGLPLNLITSLLPPVLMVVSVSAAIHLLNAFLGARTAGMACREAIDQAIREVAVACGLATLTTMLGFFSLLVSPVPAVREFALLAGLGVGISFVITITGVPLALLAVSPSPSFSAPTQGPIERCLERGLRWVLHHRSRMYIYLSTLTVILLALPGLFRLSEGTDIIRALDAKAPLRVSTEFIDQHLTGVNALELMIDLPETGWQPAFIRRVLAFSQALQAQPQVTSVHSPWAGLQLMQPERLADDQQLRVIATLLPLALPLDHWLNINAKAFRMSIRTRAMGSDQFLTLAQRVNHQAEMAGLPVQLTGTTYLLAQMSRTLVLTQLWSLGLAIVLILGTIAIALRSWRLGLLAAIPNLLPPFVVFGIMGWCGIGLSTATTMIASVALGLVVDDTIHLLYRYRQVRRTGHDPPHAMAETIRHTGRALVITTLILTLGFWAGLIGSFKPTVSFSFLTGLTMILALLADVLVLPSCLLSGGWGRNRTWR
jgi:predicted RND superfamily exporter protein